MATVKLPTIHLPGIKNILGIMSGKGGVGKTFVTINMALTFAKMGLKVGILDADLSNSTLFSMLGISAKLTPTAENKIVPIEKYGLKTIAMAGLCGSPDEPVVWRGPISSKIIQQLLKESLWGELDMLLIDFPTGVNDATLTILQHFSIQGLIMVTTPQETACLGVRRSINMAHMLEVPVLGVIENMRGEVFGFGGGTRIADMYKIPFLGSIPLKKEIVALCDGGKAPVHASEELEIVFSKITRLLLEKTMVQ